MPGAKGGSSFATGWNKALTGTGSVLYNDAVARTKAVLTANPTFQFKGILWLQGETEATSGAVTPGAYGGLMDTLIANFRADFGRPGLPVVVGEFCEAWLSDSTASAAQNDKRRRHNGIITDTARRVAQTAVVSSAGTTGDIHFDAPSYRLLGTRYATELGAAGANLVATPVPPAAPVALVVTPGSGQNTLAFAAPYSNGGSAVTGYTVEASVDGGAFRTVQTLPATTTTWTHAGLANGATYRYRVAANNSEGVGVAGASVTGMPVGAPTAPAEVAQPVVAAGVNALGVSWTAPSNGGAAITGYVVELQANGGAWERVAAGIGTLTVTTLTGLSGGTPYAVRVAATNAVGTGPASVAVAAVPSAAAVAPGQVTGLTVAPGDGQNTLSWTQPADNGAAITDYLVELLSGGAWTTLADGTSPATGFVHSGLVNGTAYSYRVSAMNAVGSGPASVAVSGTPAAIASAPGQVTGLTVAPGDRQNTLAWTAPGDGGSPFTDYLIELFFGGAWTVIADGTSTATTFAHAGLANGTTYGYRVSAKNAVGTGQVSATASGTPSAAATAPGQVTGLVLAAGVNELAATWTAPASGGAAITDYVVELRPSGGTFAPYGDGLSATPAATISGLTAGTAYEVRVAALNANGSGVFSAVATATPSGTAAAPAQVPGLSVVAGNQQNALAWTAPASGGSPITDYQIEVSAAGGAFALVADGVSTATTFAHTGLTNGTVYGYRVAAQNAVGLGTASAVVSGTPNAAAGLAEAGARGHWLLGSDNATSADLVSGQLLTPAATAPALSAGYLTTTSQANRMVTPYNDGQPLTAVVVFRRVDPTPTNAIVFGSLRPSATPTGFAIYFNSTSANSLWSNAYGQGSNAIVQNSAVAPGEWAFAAISITTASRLVYVVDGTTAKATGTATGTAAFDPAFKLSLGGANLGGASYDGDMNFAELIVFQTALTTAELDAVLHPYESAHGDARHYPAMRRR